LIEKFENFKRSLIKERRFFASLRMTVAITVASSCGVPILLPETILKDLIVKKLNNKTLRQAQGDVIFNELRHIHNPEQ